MKDEKLRQKVLKQIYELAFGDSNDAARLLFMAGEDSLCLDELDLRQVVSLHRAANGSVEVKFADRAELIELLLEATEEQVGEKPKDGGLLEAINRAAEKLHGGGDEAAEGKPTSPQSDSLTDPLTQGSL